MQRLLFLIVTVISLSIFVAASDPPDVLEPEGELLAGDSVDTVTETEPPDLTVAASISEEGKYAVDKVLKDAARSPIIVKGRVAQAASIDLDLGRGPEPFRSIQVVVADVIRGEAEALVTASVPHHLRFALADDAEYLIMLGHSDEFGYTVAATPLSIDDGFLKIGNHSVSFDDVAAAIGGAP